MNKRHVYSSLLYYYYISNFLYSGNVTLSEGQQEVATYCNMKFGHYRKDNIT